MKDQKATHLRGGRTKTGCIFSCMETHESPNGCMVCRGECHPRKCSFFKSVRNYIIAYPTKEEYAAGLTDFVVKRKPGTTYIVKKTVRTAFGEMKTDVKVTVPEWRYVHK